MQEMMYGNITFRKALDKITTIFFLRKIPLIEYKFTKMTLNRRIEDNCLPQLEKDQH